jgi:hypothetical protein
MKRFSAPFCGRGGKARFSLGHFGLKLGENLVHLARSVLVRTPIRQVPNEAKLLQGSRNPLFSQFLEFHVLHDVSPFIFYAYIIQIYDVPQIIKA